ncbi:hypothetical protein [Streptomyces lutosisoli]|uniref:Uncharacterized protein n=1 Tax=Streptomyces lutosisoli TaxID=2665721 RepID=A0ABW2VXH2_9ACTN
MPAGRASVVCFTALDDNGHFDTYWVLHPAREHQRRCPTPDQHTYELTA